MKQDNTASNHTEDPQQEPCPECSGYQIISKPTKNSRIECSQCAIKSFENSDDEGRINSRTLYVSETYFNELMEKLERTDMTEAQHAEIKRTLSDPALFDARVEEIQKDLEKKPPVTLIDHDGGDGDENLEDAKDEVEETE
ncbi:hypothetical protein FKW77_002592 [Venturia effusa]|uniref:Uncharacterized protein n=1 Tax=Venturia effusa TaxID=50376 RepID=A0A517LL25_9PEZI|nr:hypothetical protein FKW77_002592 [Venturia effusa]